MITLSRAVNSVASGVVITLASEDQRLLRRQNRLFNTGFKRNRRMAISPVPTSGVSLPETSTYRHNIRESSVHRSHLQSILLTYAAGEYSPILRSMPDGPLIYVPRARSDALRLLTSPIGSPPVWSLLPAAPVAQPCRLWYAFRSPHHIIIPRTFLDIVIGVPAVVCSVCSLKSGTYKVVAVRAPLREQMRLM